MPIFIGYYYTQVLFLINPLQILQIFSQVARCQFCVQKGKEKILVKVVVEAVMYLAAGCLGKKAVCYQHLLQSIPLLKYILSINKASHK